jgi:hypothetical protein
LTLSFLDGLLAARVLHLATFNRIQSRVTVAPLPVDHLLLLQGMALAEGALTA